MPQSVPKINAVVGSNNDLPINTLVQLDNQNSGGEVSFLWEILDQPLGVVDALSNPNIQNPTFTPKKEGTYLIRLTVNALLISTIIAAVREVKSRQRIVAAGEVVEDDPVDGWATAGDATLRFLLAGNADPGIVVGVTGAGGMLAGQVVYVSQSATIKPALPGAEAVPIFSLAVAVGANEQQLHEPLYLLLGGVDGSATPANGALIRARLFGLQAITVGAAVPGDMIWVDRNANLKEVTPDRVPRQVGVQVSGTHIFYDGRYASNAALDLYTSLLADVPVGPVNATRFAHRTGVLQLSTAGGPYTPIPLGTEPYLTDGAVASLTNERNIQSLAVVLNFNMGAVGPQINFNSFPGNEAQDLTTWNGVAGINGFGSAYFDGGNLVISGGLLDGTNNVDTDGFLTPSGTLPKALTTVDYVNAATSRGNTIFVDKVFGNDGTGTRQGFPFLTIAAALAVALSGDVVLVGPGAYSETGLVIPTGVTVRGVSTNAVTIQQLAATVAVTLVTMGPGSILENLSLVITSVQHHTFKAVVFSGISSSYKVRNCVISIDNAGAGAGTSSITAIHSTGTGAPASNVYALDNVTVLVTTANLGNKRALLHDTAAGTIRAKECLFRVIRTGAAGTYIAVEVNQAASTVTLKDCVMEGSDADISRTSGVIEIAGCVFVNNASNSLGFTPLTPTDTVLWGSTGAQPNSVTRFMYPGMGGLATTEITKMRCNRKRIARSIAVRASTGPGGILVDTWRLRKNGADTALVVTLTGAAVSNELNNVSVDFAEGDDISVSQVTVASTTEDPIVTVEFY